MIPRELLLAIEAAKPDRYCRRVMLVGAVARRRDGVLVTACNGSAERRIVEIHAEARVARKSGYGAEFFVARVKRGDGSIGLARPCKLCMSYMKSKRVTRVTYTVSDGLWETHEISSDN